jgi:hypothetical protein
MLWDKRRREFQWIGDDDFDPFGCKGALYMGGPQKPVQVSIPFIKEVANKTAVGTKNSHPILSKATLREVASKAVSDRDAFGGHTMRGFAFRLWFNPLPIFSWRRTIRRSPGVPALLMVWRGQVRVSLR